MNDRGMTLLELLVAVLLASLLLTLAVPGFRDLMARVEAWRVTSELAQACRAARLVAASRGYAVGLCGSESAAACDGHWSEGILLFVDRNRSRTRETDEEILRFSSLRARHSEIHWNGFTGNQALLVEGVGIPYASNGSFTYCSRDHQAKYRRQVIVSRSGRVRLSSDRDGDGVHESVNGGLIECP